MTSLCRSNEQLHLRGYKEERTTRMPCNKVVRNDLDRFHRVEDVIDRLPQIGARAANYERHIRELSREHEEYSRRHGDPLPAMRARRWGESKATAGRRTSDTGGDNA